MLIAYLLICAFLLEDVRRELRRTREEQHGKR